MAESSSNGPVPSKHVFIHQLSIQDTNAKVRFLCCVKGYDYRTGRLMVEHDYPRDQSSKSPTKAAIDTSLVLETIEREILQPGSWINVIGYVQSKPIFRSRRPSLSRRDAIENVPIIQAVLMWSAGAVQVDRYEKTLEEHIASMSKQ